jgi:hypothetical protein
MMSALDTRNSVDIWETMRYDQSSRQTEEAA